MSQPFSQLRSPSNRVWLVAGLGVVFLGIAIAVWLYPGNSATAGACPVQPTPAAAMEAAGTGQLAALTGTGEGRGYADLAFYDEQGTEMSLADFSGKSLLVNFWATWCIPCREEMPELDALAARYNSDSFEVVPISFDPGDEGTGKARAFLDEIGLTNLPLYIDPSLEGYERLKREGATIGLPLTVLLDPKGCELAILQGPAVWDSPDGWAVVEALIGLDETAG